MHEEHLTISRVGDSIKEINVMEGVEYTFNMKLNEELDWHDKAEKPRFHFNVIYFPYFWELNNTDILIYVCGGRLILRLFSDFLKKKCFS